MQAPLRLMCRFLTRTSPFAASLLFSPDTKPITNTSRGGRRARHPKTHYLTVFLFSSRRDACRITSWRTKLADQPASSRRNSLCLNSCPCRCCLPGFVGFERFVFSARGPGTHKYARELAKPCEVGQRVTTAVPCTCRAVSVPRPRRTSHRACASALPRSSRETRRASARC